VGLALADTRVWFPNWRVQWAWVAFDVLLIALMFSLGRRWRARLLSMGEAFRSAGPGVRRARST
jgi:hypothetical protein